MKTKNYMLMAVGMLSILVLGACSAQAEEAPAEAPPAVPQEAPMTAPTTPAAETQPSAAVAEEEALPSAEVDMEALIASKVAGNHDVERIFTATKTREEWNATLDRMIGYGAKMTEEEKQLIIDYLLSR